MTGTLKNAPCRKEKPFMQAISEVDQSGCLEFWNSRLVQLPSRFNWKMDDCLEDTKTTLYRGQTSSKSLLLNKRSPHHRQLNSQNYSQENPWRSQLSLCNQLPKTSQKSAILLETDKSLDIWLILLLSDLLCYGTETLKNCRLSFVVDVDVIVIVSIA